MGSSLRSRNNYLSGKTLVPVTTDRAVTSLSEVIARALGYPRACRRCTAKVCCQRAIPIVNGAGQSRHCQQYESYEYRDTSHNYLPYCEEETAKAN